MTLTVTNPHHWFRCRSSIFTLEGNGDGLGTARSTALPLFAGTTELGAVLLSRFTVTVEELDTLTLPGTLAVWPSLQTQIMCEILLGNL